MAPDLLNGYGGAMNESRLNQIQVLRWVLAILWSITFLYLLVVFSPSGSDLAAFAGSWSQRLGLPPGSFFKAGHVMGYVLWVLLWSGVISEGYRRPLPRGVLPWLPVLLFLLVAVPEALQNLNPGRHPCWLDVGYNGTGALIGLGSRLLIVREAQAA